MVFRLYHGQGNVRYSPYGVDLSELGSTLKGIERPAERSFPAVYNWLMRGFRVDPQVNAITVYVVVSRATEGFFWELMPVDSTATWRWYVENALQRGWPLGILVSVYEKDNTVSMVGQDEEGSSMTGGDAETAEGNESEHQEEEEEEEAGGGGGGEDREPRGLADEGERNSTIVEVMDREDFDNEHAEDDESSDEDDSNVNPS